MDPQTEPSHCASNFQPVFQRCDCGMEECEECFNFALELEEEAEIAERFQFLNNSEDNHFSRRLEAGDDDDFDEEDAHGAHSIDDPEGVGTAH